MGMHRRGWGSGALAIGLVAVTVGLWLAPAAVAKPPHPPVPTVTPAPTAGVHDHALFDSYYELAPFGYEEQEYFVSGTATSDDGTTTAPYTTRMIVTRPTKKAGDGPDFNGTVMLDWTNVTAQFENAVDTMEARQMLMREGFAFVHVSAQAAGVDGTPLTPKKWDPVRYAALHHPGDQFANDMFTQIAYAFRTSTTFTGGKKVDHVLGAGQSQSGSKLDAYATTYLPSHPQAAGVIDGLLVHGAASSEEGKATLAAAAKGVKVLHLLSDQEAVEDTFDPSPFDGYRLWEVAGTAHSDLFIGYQSVAGFGPRTAADTPPVDRAGYDEIIRNAGNYGAELHPMLATCLVGGATMPMHYATSTAIHQLNQWVEGGRAPANGPRFAFDDAGKEAVDQYGNSLGGIRMPPIDVPVAQYRSTQCPLGGITVPFSDAQLQTMYPTFAGYYDLMAQRTVAAVAQGWLLPEDATDLMARVCAARARWNEPDDSACTPVALPRFDSDR
jgi:hypothetical protein